RRSPGQTAQRVGGSTAGLDLAQAVAAVDEREPRPPRRTRRRRNGRRGAAMNRQGWHERGRSWRGGRHDGARPGRGRRGGAEADEAAGEGEGEQCGSGAAQGRTSLSRGGRASVRGAGGGGRAEPPPIAQNRLPRAETMSMRWTSWMLSAVVVPGLT